VVDVMFPWWDSRPGLSPVRLCKPANYEPAEVDDEVLSSIGRDLLTLAARRKATEPRFTQEAPNEARTKQTHGRRHATRFQP
jgi:hypothetical protein